MEKIYEVKGMTCVICKGNVEKALRKLNGVNNASVNLLDNTVLIDYDEKIVKQDDFIKTISDAGYQLLTDNKNKLNIDLIKMIVSIIFLIILMFLSMAFSKETLYIQLFISLIILIINKDIFVSGYKALLKFNPNMFSLVSLSSSFAFIYSIFALIMIKLGNSYNVYFETAGMVITIVKIGKFIEGNTKKKTTKVIRGLATLIPMQANLIDNEKIKVIKIEDLKKNDIVLVKPGESIPQDGVVEDGISSVDESMITGESKLVNKTKGDEVIGGTINADGSLKIRITKSTNTTVLSNIINLTKKAAMEKMPIERLADNISKYFVYGVISISVITFIIWIISSKDFELSLNFALTVLVISCPCALGLATPSAIAVALGRAAKNGVLIKKPEILEIVGKLKTIVFDKTGTLTNSSLEVIKVIQLDKEFLNILSSIEATSNHPISKAILDKYPFGYLKFNSSKFIPGEGIIAKDAISTYYAGNIALMTNNNIAVNQKYIDEAINNNYTLIALGKDNKLLGIVYLSETVRDDAKECIDSLLNRNIKPIMCTGDSDMAAEKIANDLNIKTYYYQSKPEDKNQIVIKEKNNGTLAMVGDGVNDAIALMNADISITIKDGTDIANGSSDIVLMKNNLKDISFIYDLSKKTMRIIKQNLLWALFYNVICILIAAGILYKPLNIVFNPMIGSAFMLISSIFVLLNALRINKI